MSPATPPISLPHSQATASRNSIVVQTRVHPSSEASTVQHDAKRRLIGLSLMAASAFMFSVMSLNVHILGRSLGAMQIGIYRFLVQGVICSCVMWYKGVSWRPATRKIGWLLFLRGFLGTAAMLGYFYALTHMIMSDATVIVFTNPIFTSIFGAVILKEGWTWIDFLATCVCFTGVIFVAQPSAIFGGGPTSSSPSTSVVPVLVALSSAVVSSSGFVVIRVLGGLVDANVVVFWYGLVGVAMSVLAALAMETFVWPLPSTEIGLILMMGVFAYTGQWCMSKGLQMEKTGPAIMMRYLDIVCSFVWQITLLHEPVTVWSAVGAVLVTSCAFVNPVKQWRAMRDSKPIAEQQVAIEDEHVAVDTNDTNEKTGLISPSQSSSPCLVPASARSDSGFDGNDDDDSEDADLRRLLGDQPPVDVNVEIEMTEQK